MSTDDILAAFGFLALAIGGGMSLGVMIFLAVTGFIERREHRSYLADLEQNGRKENE